ncbi:MAG: DUF2339 domain-containing protein [Pseudomonadota bacterium]
MLLFAGLVLAVFGGSIAGFVAVSRTNDLRRENRLMRDRLESLSRQIEALRSEAAAGTQPADPTTAQMRAEALEELRQSIAARQESGASADSLPEEAPTDEVIVHPTPTGTGQTRSPLAPFLENLQTNWMTWLGGACVSLAGIFLVRYSMDQGWLGPVARILAGLATGGALLGVADVLRRRNTTPPPALAAMAGAGSITLYGALFAALKMYALISHATAFAAMAVVAVGTMALALLYGPVLAAFGILGAYLVPILVSTGSGEIVLALGYALVVSLSALLLLRHVYRPWLWWGFVVGALGWWFLSLSFGDAGAVRSIYLTVLAYLIAAAPTGDWLLRDRLAVDYQGYSPKTFIQSLSVSQRSLLLTYVLVVLAAGVGLAVSDRDVSAWTQGLPLFVLMLWMARQRDAVFMMPWTVLLVTAGAWLVHHVDGNAGVLSLVVIDASRGTEFLAYLFVFALIAGVAGLALFRVGRRPAIWASLATLAPMVLVALGYVLNLRPGTDSFWALSTGVLALGYVALAGSFVQKRSIESVVVWLFIAGHFGFGLAAAMMLQTAGLTLAIAAQMLSLAWVIRRFDLPELSWLFKLVVAIVIVRLTLNPWLMDYSTDTHWSLWTFGGSTLIAVLAAYWLRNASSLSQWAEGAALHLFVLTLWSELRYQLNDGNVYSRAFSFTEVALTMVLAGALGLVYFHRAKFSRSLVWLYRRYADVLAVGSLVLYAVIVLRTLGSDTWAYVQIGSTPIVNVSTLAFGAPVALGWLYARFFAPVWRPRALMFTGASLFVFLSLQVRHLWTGTTNLNSPPMADGELYTYSAVWLVLAIGAMLAGSFRDYVSLYRAGIVVLALVIAKLFLVDLSGLEGLLRVASFMGLGLSLLGVAYLHQRLGSREPTAEG